MLNFYTIANGVFFDRGRCNNYHFWTEWDGVKKDDSPNVGHVVNFMIGRCNYYEKSIDFYDVRRKYSGGGRCKNCGAWLV